MSNEIKKLCKARVKVINIGVRTLAASLKQQGVETAHVDWHPPAGGDLRIAKLLEKLHQDSSRPYPNEHTEKGR
ncbi:MAG: fdrA domain protein [Chloroflexi bacterium]|nr:fdrA domain protein [Chloroflexota bacterium]